MEEAMKFSDLSVYIDLIRSLLNNEITATDFKSQYLRLFKQDETRWNETIYEILNELFGDLDSFYADPELRDPGDLDEDQLRQKSEAALNKLLSINNDLA
jgi:hypothetical protein